MAAIKVSEMASPINGMATVERQDVPEGFSLIGEKYGIVAKTLAPGEQFLSGPGAMMFQSNDVKMDTGLGGARARAARGSPALRLARRAFARRAAGARAHHANAARARARARSLSPTRARQGLGARSPPPSRESRSCGTRTRTTAARTGTWG